MAYLAAVCFLAGFALVSASQQYKSNAMDLGLVSDTYPMEFWETLANLKDAELRPNFLRVVLYLDRNRAGNDHWCCNNGRTSQAKTPVYNNRGEIVAWNTVPCPQDQLGCCYGFLQVANHCLDKEGQKNLLDALDISRDRLGDKDTADLIDLIKQGGIVG
ncbi:uncharacterized protein [Watersipora subatra]|uniref:uncharacterized protein n=1 Tax=Watersipora subatra TaxID=2589382 RepID=UPI00355C8263